MVTAAVWGVRSAAQAVGTAYGAEAKDRSFLITVRATHICALQARMTSRGAVARLCRAECIAPTHSFLESKLFRATPALS